MAIQLPETDKPYYLLIGDPIIYAKAEQLGISAVFYKDSDLDTELLGKAKENDKSILLLKYDISEENEFSEIQRRKIDGSACWVVSYNIYATEYNEHIITTPEKAADYLPKIIDDMEHWMVSSGIYMITDYEGRCGNCHSLLGDSDKYCKYCGTKRGEGAFLPYFNETYYAYGPPIKTIFTCRSCGHSWETKVWGGDNSKYCPHCGKQALALQETEMDYEEFFKTKKEENEQDTERSD